MNFPDTRRLSTADRLKPSVNYSRPVTFHYEIQNHTTRMQKLSKAVKVYRLTVLTLICVLAGLAIGLISRPYAKNWTEREFMYIEMPGELYLRLLKLIIIPLLVSNVILSFGTIHGKLSSHLAKIASFLYLGSNLMAITVAIVLALLIGPGKLRQTSSKTSSSTTTTTTFGENLQNFLPNMDNHHYFTELHDSINRYRDYHPMFYHTERGDYDNENLAKSARLQSSSYKTISNKTENKVNIKEEEEAILSKLLNSIINDNDNELKRRKTMKASQINHMHSKSSAEGKGNGQQRIAFNTKLPIDVVLDMMRNLIPDSIVGATIQQSRTRIFPPKELIINKDGTTSPPPSDWLMGHELVQNSPNIIGLLAISVLVGVVLSHMEEGSKPMLELCSCISELSLRIGMMAINLTPFCIMFLLIGQVARARDLSFMAGELFMYTITILIALFIHGFILLPLAYYLIVKKSPIKFLLTMLEALVASFATSSSSATIALVLNCLTDINLNPIIVRAFGPLGSVFNMNGTAIYEAIGTIFIAQTLNVSLPFTSILLIGLTSAVASLSTTGIPSSGMMTIVIVLNAINLPVLQLSLIYIVDFIIDRFRTVINVWSGAIVCALINHICPEYLFEDEQVTEKFRELKRRSTILHNNRKPSTLVEIPKQVISVTITPPVDLTTTTTTTTTSSPNMNNQTTTCTTSM